MVTTDAKVKKLMEEIQKGALLGVAALRADMGRKTASKYKGLGKLPSELKEPRTWRTREDPFAADRAWMEAVLSDTPELEAKTLFEYLQTRKPDVYAAGQLRTFQRHVQEWRARSGPPKEVFFAQVHRPGEAMQTDFTWATSLGVTIAGEPFNHMLCHAVLPYSNWGWATVCQSESMAALRRGVQSAMFRLGRRPEWHQTDNSTAATHDLATGKRGFNAEYLALMGHLGMKPRTIAVGASEQNGDVEASNGALKRRLTQHLLLRGHRDFESRDAYEAFVQGVCEKANGLRGERVSEELRAMQALSCDRLPEFTTEDVQVSSWSTIRIKHNAYSVPSRLIDETVRVRVYDDRLEVYYGGHHELTVGRLLGRAQHAINYRHIIWSLVKKPGAFARYRYREAMFPTLTFRRAFDALQKAEPGARADLEYLRVLHLAASTMESEVDVALQLLLEAGSLRQCADVHAVLGAKTSPAPAMAPLVPDLASYDRLLAAAQEAA